MARKLLFLSSLLVVLLIPSALLAAEPVDPAEPVVPVDAAGCAASEGLMTHIFGDQPMAPTELDSPPLAVRQEWCGECIGYDCSANCYPCSGRVAACAPRCTPICWCFTC